jgi:hypothetical protein
MFAKGTESVWTHTSELLFYSLNRVSLCTQFIGLTIVAVEWAALFIALRDKDPAIMRLTSFFLCGLLVFLQVVAMCLAPFYPVDWSPDSNSVWYSVDIWLIAVLFFLTSSLFFISGMKFGRGLDNLVSLPQRDEKIKFTLKKVNYTALICTIIFGIRFLSWAYGSLVFDLYLVDEKQWMWDIDQVLYPTVHYTLPDIIPDVVLLLLLSPNASEYVQTTPGDEEEGEDYDPQFVYHLSVNHPPSSGGSAIDQDDDERMRSKKKIYKRSGRTSSLEDDILENYQKEASTIIGGSESEDSSPTHSSQNSHKQTEDFQPLMVGVD